ncbi:MAG: glycoside hydrolase family 32 protein [Terriglobia bacterium]
MKAVTAAIPKAESDPNRPVYHFHPPANWNNDPNGPIWYKGWYHLFYQHNPYAAVWGHMHWGHARSRDLVNWEHLPIALWPSRDKGEEHCFSGGAALAGDGRPRLIYTSIGNRDPEQWMAIPKDDELLTWEKYPGNPILTLKIHGNRRVYDWRDPFLFHEPGKTYMVCGGNINGQRQGGGAEVQLYEATKADLSEWKYRGDVFDYLDREVINIECPNLFKLGSKWVLLCSPNKNCEYFVGDLDLLQGKFIPEARGVLDAGSAYASNILQDEQGRPVLWLWGKTYTNPDKGWNGCMGMPRVLTIDDTGFLRQNPLQEFESLRGEARMAQPAVLEEKPRMLDERISGDCLELQAELSTNTAATVGLRVRCAADGGGGTEISFNPQNSMITAGKAQKLIGNQQPVRLRVFLDKCVMEVYVNDGLAAIFTTVDAGQNDVGITAFAKGGTARLDSLKMWPLKPARFSLERFKV